jgi:hypothetical protein
MPAKAGIHALPARSTPRQRRNVPARAASTLKTKSFLLLFFKKEALSFR